MSRNFNERLETYVLSVIEGRRNGRRAIFLRFTLKQLSYLFNALVQLRLMLYNHRIFRPNTLGCQVISVGNLTVGGTGKTPIVEIFARSLQQGGRKVAILSRGYKKANPPLIERIINKFTLRERKQPPLIVSDGKRLLLDSSVSGDEPYMLASNLPNVIVLVDKDRVKSGKYAVQQMNCDTLILDDGFQYLRLKHRVDIVLVDSTNPFGYRHTLPRGLLRERVKNIRRATFIFITKCESGGAPELKRELRELNPDAEIAECRHCPRHLRNVYTRERQNLDFLQGKKVATVSGIAAPIGFEAELIRLGAEIIHHKRYADHHRYSQFEIIDRINKSIERGAEMIITTEKDAVRFPKIDRRDLPIYYLRVQIELLSGEGDFNACIRRICFQSHS